ncbi:MAG: TRAP transporter solute receptor TAXI family [Bacillota bacterium]|nr:MAG: TRAP transporter solute receptor TAXI family [Bacillota bacterium]
MSQGLKKSALFALILVIAMVAVACAPKAPVTPGTTTPPKTVHITMGTAGVGGTNYPLGIAMASLWNANIPGVKAVAIATAGSPNNIDLLRQKEAEVAVCRSLEAYRATNGIAPYPEKMPWLRSITGGLFVDAMQVVGVNGKVKSISEFKGKRIGVGPIGSGSEVDAREIIKAHNMIYEDMQIFYVEPAQAIEMIDDGLLDGAVVGVALGSAAIQELMLGGHVTLLPIEDEFFANLKAANELLVRTTIPANLYPKQDYTVKTAAAPPDIIIARADLDEELAYNMTKTLYENLNAIHNVAVLLQQFTSNLVLPEKDMLIPYHPGTKKYFQEKGWLPK